MNRWPRKPNNMEEFGVSPIRDIFRLTDKILSEFIPDIVRYETAASFPAMELIDKENEMVLKVELPGIEEENIELNVKGDVLTIKGERKKEEVKEGENYLFSEISYGKFERSIRLPKNVDFDKAEAEFKNGILVIRIPKKEEEKTKKIPIKK